jgi:nitroimidazol reductase NimA-like FMN-containing flavoprotein (pyridoxamine 5'-phosphate oxidase superfamily)
MRANPQVCIEVDEVISYNRRTSVIAFGRYQELPDMPEPQQLRVVCTAEATAV